MAQDNWWLRVRPSVNPDTNFTTFRDWRYHLDATDAVNANENSPVISHEVSVPFRVDVGKSFTNQEVHEMFPKNNPFLGIDKGSVTLRNVGRTSYTFLFLCQNYSEIAVPSGVPYVEATGAYGLEIETAREFFQPTVNVHNLKLVSYPVVQGEPLVSGASQTLAATTFTTTRDIAWFAKVTWFTDLELDDTEQKPTLTLRLETGTAEDALTINNCVILDYASMALNPEDFDNLNANINTTNYAGQTAANYFLKESQGEMFRGSLRGLSGTKWEILGLSELIVVVQQEDWEPPAMTPVVILEEEWTPPALTPSTIIEEDWET